MTDSHYCKIHDTIFFKKATMKGYAHPVKDENNEDVLNAKGRVVWCNEEDTKSYHPVNEEESPVVEEAKKMGAEVVSVEPNKMTKDDWADKDTRTRKSIERQKSLDCAVNWCAEKVQSGADIQTAEVISVAIKFAAFIESGRPA